MSSFVRVPSRTTIWKCPKCGMEKETVERPNPWIYTCFPALFGSGQQPPVCPKCKVKMEKMTSFTI